VRWGGEKEGWWGGDGRGSWWEGWEGLWVRLTVEFASSRAEVSLVDAPLIMVSWVW
jgi:hypothetical protein